MPKNIEISVDHLSTFSLAAQQNAYPLLRNLSVFYKEIIDSDSSDNKPTLRNLVVRLRSESEIFIDEEWAVDEIRPNQVVSLQKRPLQTSHSTLLDLTEEVRATLTLTVESRSEGTTYASKTITVTVLPANFWGGESRQPDLLAAFVKPNGIYVESLVRPSHRTS